MSNSAGKSNEKLHFSEVVKFEKLEDDLKKNNALCYIAGTGCGKTGKRGFCDL